MKHAALHRTHIRATRSRQNVVEATMTERTSREIDFSVFLIHRVAESWQKTPSETFRLLDDANLISEYIVPFYDVLHTLGEEYLVQNITELAEKRGVTL